MLLSVDKLQFLAYFSKRYENRKKKYLKPGGCIVLCVYGNLFWRRKIIKKLILPAGSRSKQQLLSSPQLRWYFTIFLCIIPSYN